MSRGSESRRIRKTSSVARTDMLVEVKLNFLQHVFRTGIHGPEYMPSTREPIPCAACLLLTFWLPTGCQWRLPTLYQIVVFDRYPLGHRSRAIFFDSLLNVFDIAYNARHGRMTVKKKSKNEKCPERVSCESVRARKKQQQWGRDNDTCMYVYIYLQRRVSVARQPQKEDVHARCDRYIYPSVHGVSATEADLVPCCANGLDRTGAVDPTVPLNPAASNKAAFDAFDTVLECNNASDSAIDPR